MKRRMWIAAAGCGLLVSGALVGVRAQGPAGPVGIFEGHGDVGTVLHPGAVEYDASARTYTVSGSGENMWATADGFQFVWKKASGDLSLTADIAFADQSGNEHKKAVLIFRQSLDADSAYADVALHRVGLTSIQSREEKGAATHEVQASVSGPKRLRLTKRGAYFYMSLGDAGAEPQFSGASMRVPLQDPYYVGIGVCSHDKDRVEKAVFSNVELAPAPPAAGRGLALWSTLETVTVASTDRRVTFAAPERIEAPNWSRDGKTLLFTLGGRIQTVPETGGNPEVLDTVTARHANTAHALSPDGSQLAFSDESRGGRSLIYIVPVTGGPPHRLSEEGPSYVYSWSPDGATLAFAGRRAGKINDVYTIPVKGGFENRLTYGTGLNDAPDYSPDGQLIYFHSDRSGSIQIWRMKPDGKKQEQVTTDDFNNAFPHVSPNGRQIVFLSYPKEIKSIPEDKEVTLRVMNLETRNITVLAKLTGGRGTIDAASWSPDSRRLAFVSCSQMPAPPKKR